ncbi:hypothetical protein GLOIN_2v1765531 [Rhizophagus irregularis DAOM 181602=DAOM 197198]|uniref:Uncharacterized protein n=1 Tax=Rhizophagus irregularis (strain DAOM 181602 / DAOM 197198 / MUCL 43194) TaxID=747089 RepID=A0A2P4QPM3_RHIID|nr:hypothetical protein GLOIN_2v1765531 [Rhizophagus irregularis DAOM 181602=DAOM 197198]POG79584.1 hypothetical protein GLOIN_2v1765531 [Rhizophagus irregularis DAOM 181602=DAOM 197198]GET57354.1 hypothetical protein GLOIN_2v1765531 [Rhizophagus irregularis DAOM 181602=DAOM 197198]|eukprot:XP_025186450.1 hypothetical protein GLOIN_2v1765531 [Rhizophagus irregularis DAOM 181602=DAOM 197198]
MTSRTLSTATYVAPFVQTSKVLISKSPSELRNTSFGAALPSTLVLAINHHLVLVLYDIDKRRNEFIERRITKAENKFLFLIVGATFSTIGATKMFLEKKETGKKIAGV